jgi:hypothetical protein
VSFDFFVDNINEIRKPGSFIIAIIAFLYSLFIYFVKTFASIAILYAPFRGSACKFGR